jgi:Ca-activated chloride channel family protein
MSFSMRCRIDALPSPRRRLACMPGMITTAIASRTVAAAVAVAVALIAGIVDPSVFGQQPAFRSGVELVTLSVTVTSGGNQFVSDLTREDFVVLEENAPQKLTHFAKGGVPLALALLMDTSASMEQVLETAQEAAIGFVRQLGPADVATVIDFDSRVQTAQDFTSETGALENAIRATRAGGSTSLHNALYIALKQLAKLTPSDDPGDPRRRAIVVLSDGEDTSSLVSFDEVFDLASRSDTVIYAIGLGSNDSLNSRGSNDGVFLLRRLTQQTGGRAFFPRVAADLANVYSDIRNELASQYLLAYESSGVRDGRWRRIAVRVTRPNVAVRTRQGYFASRR